MKPLTIGFDAKRIFNNSTGLGVYSRNLVSNLIEHYPENNYVLFTPKISFPFEITAPNLEVVFPKTPFTSLWRTSGINKDIERKQIDIYHGLSNEIPIRLNPSTRYVCTIHDLIWLKLPSAYNAIDRIVYTKKLKHACQYSDILIATSQQTADDLQEIMKVPASKIRVVYQTGPSVILNIDSESPLKNPYLFYLSSFEQRKNHLSLLKTFFKCKGGQNIKLVLAGKPGPSLPLIQRFIEKYGLGDEVIILQNITDEEKFTWLKHAKSFVYPSVYEGFGIPLLEAMKIGTPLLLNNLPVFKEIAGETAKYFDLNIEKDFENKLNQIIESPKGIVNYTEQLQKFTSKETSSSLWKVYEELM